MCVSIEQTRKQINQCDQNENDQNEGDVLFEGEGEGFSLCEKKPYDKYIILLSS